MQTELLFMTGTGIFISAIAYFLIGAFYRACADATAAWTFERVEVLMWTGLMAMLGTIFCIDLESLARDVLRFNTDDMGKLYALGVHIVVVAAPMWKLGGNVCGYMNAPSPDKTPRDEGVTIGG